MNSNNIVPKSKTTLTEFEFNAGFYESESQLIAKLQENVDKANEKVNKAKEKQLKKEQEKYDIISTAIQAAISGGCSIF